MKYYVSDHQITLYYFFKDEVNIEALTFDKLKDLGLSPRYTEFLHKENSKLRKNNIWEQQRYTDLSPDLIPNIHTLFNGEDSIITTWKLKENALNLINGKPAQNNKKGTNSPSCVKLGLSLKPAAKARLENNDDNQPCLNIQNIFFHQFKTNYGVASVELSLNKPNPSPQLIQEVVYSLARFNTLCWQEPDDQYQCNTRTTLGLMVRQLLQNIDTTDTKEKEARRKKRVYTNTYVQLRKGTPESEYEVNTKLYLIKLAKHYNDDYAISKKNIENKRIISDFDDIKHLITHEGSATLLLLNQKAPKFLEGYKHNAIKQVYNSIHLLSFYTENAIKHYIADGTVWLNSHCPEPQLQTKLKQHQLQLLNLNYHFFHPVISNVDTHNIIQKELIQANQLDKQHQKITEHNQTINQLIINCSEQQKLKDKQKQQQETQKAHIEYCKIAAIGVSTAAFYTVFQITEAIIKSIKQECLLSPVPSIANFLKNHSTFIELSISLLIAVCVFAFTRNHCKHANKK